MCHPGQDQETKRLAPSALLPLVIGCTLCGPLHAAEPNTKPTPSDVVYTVRPGDTLSQVAGSQLGSTAEWKTLQKLNRIENPDLLKPGTTLYLPAARHDRKPAEAEAIMVKGEVRFRPKADGPAAPLTSGTRLTAGSVIETGATGLLTLRFADGSRILVSPDSSLTLRQMAFNTTSGVAVTRATLETGNIQSFVMRLRGLKARYEVKTPSLNLAVRGTAFRVQFDDRSGEAHTSVSEGEVKAANEFGEVSLPAGTGTVATLGRPPAPPRPLLPPPRLDESATAVDAFPVRFSWQPLPGAQRYRVELHEGGSGDDRLAATAAVDETASRWRHLPNGEYRLRMRGVDDLKLDGKSAEFAFKVQAWPAPPLTAAPADGTVVAADRVKFRWARAMDAEYLRFQVATDPGFQQLAMDVRNLTGRSNGMAIPLPPGRYFWRIAAGSAADGTGPFGPVHSFEVASASRESAARRLLHWRTGVPGERYGVQIARQGDFAAPLVDTQLDEAQVPIPGGDGPLYVRIKRIAPDGFGGEFETAQVFDPQD